MNTSTKELNLEELEQVNGGFSWKEFLDALEDFFKRPQPGFGA